MMNRKLIAILLLAPTLSVVSADATDMGKIEKAREEWTKQYFAKQGSPIPDGGVTILPENQMAGYVAFKEQRAKEKADIKKYGYIKNSTPQTQSLMNFKEISKNQFAAKEANPASEGLRKNINEIEMAYVFHGVPENAVTKMLGVAPSVTYITDQGWAGAMQFFEKDGLGTCSYRENNLKFSHGSAIIPAEDATKEVNGKITVTTITGEENRGFIYEVDWYDDNYFRELNCANAIYSVDIMTSALELARTIDNNG
jgi:hypothetical protein